jgi:hypothetical protein
MFTALTAPINNVSKTFVYLDYWSLHKRIFAVNWYTRVSFRRADGCLNCRIQIERVFMFSRVLRDKLMPDLGKDEKKPKIDSLYLNNYARGCDGLIRTWLT